jgi:hypothetical protein
MGVPLETGTWLLGDNQSVITQCTVPASTLTKRHNALAYHRIRWAVAAGVIKFVKISGKENAADCLTKFLAYADAWPLLKPIIFWKGETLDPGELNFLFSMSTLHQGEPDAGETYAIVPGLANMQGECYTDGGFSMA